MGKTASGAVWLDGAMVSPWDYWQFWRNCEDADVGRFLKLFTELPLDEIARLEALEGAEINEAKKILATAATAMLHGENEAIKAENTARQAFEEGQSAAGLPTVEIAASELDAGIGLLAAFVTAGLAQSNSDARRSVTSGAVRINDAVENDPKRQLTRADVADDGAIKLSMGKKKHVLIRPA